LDINSNLRKEKNMKVIDAVSLMNKVDELADEFKVWISVYQRDEAVVPPPIPPVPPVIPPPIPQPTGEKGSKTNPYKMNKPAGGFNVYIPEGSSGNTGAITIPAGGKVYFEVDPGEISGKFKVSAKFFGGGGAVCELTQDKATGEYSPEVCKGYSSYNKIFTISNKKYLFAIDNTGVTAGANDEIWVVMPFVP
jgi:hypothetical protein